MSYRLVVRLKKSGNRWITTMPLFSVMLNNTLKMGKLLETDRFL